jgi:hypothetical protein
MHFRHICATFILFLHAELVCASQSDWQIQIILTADDYTDNATWLGVNKQAKTDLDVLDFRKPVVDLPIPQVYFYRPEWDSVYSAFAADIRPLFDVRESWDFQIKSPINRQIDLSFSGIDQLDSDYHVYLIDVLRNQQHEVKSQSSVPVTITQSITNFRLIVGAALTDESDDVGAPTGIEIGNNFPNPFNAETTIPIHLTDAAHVVVIIYNLQGQRVRTLFNGWLPGFDYMVRWDGTDRENQPVPSGVYFSCIDAGNHRSVRHRMILLR